MLKIFSHNVFIRKVETFCFLLFSGGARKLSHWDILMKNGWEALVQFKTPIKSCSIFWPPLWFIVVGSFHYSTTFLIISDNIA